MVRFIDHLNDKVLFGAANGIHVVGVGSVLYCIGGDSICLTLSSPRQDVDLERGMRLYLLSKEPLL